MVSGGEIVLTRNLGSVPMRVRWCRGRNRPNQKITERAYMRLVVLRWRFVRAVRRFCRTERAGMPCAAVGDHLARPVIFWLA